MTDWMKHFYVWDSKDEGNTCVLGLIQNSENSELLNRAEDFSTGWPPNVYFPMSPDFPKDVGLADNLQNLDRVAVISDALKQFLEKKELKNVQFLPTGVMNHKSKLVARQYFILNPLNALDCLDVKKSEPAYYNIAPTQVWKVKSLVVDPENIPPGISVFRIKNFWSPIVIRAELANEITAAGFSGILWKNPLKYKG